MLDFYGGDPRRPIGDYPASAQRVLPRGAKSKMENKEPDFKQVKSRVSTRPSRTQVPSSWYDSLALISLALILLVGFASSDFLTSWAVTLAVTLAGTTGAIIAVTRKNERLTATQIGLGLSAGFIAFLMVRGGQGVFLIQADGKTSSLNAYSRAVFGLMLACLPKMPARSFERSWITS